MSRVDFFLLLNDNLALYLLLLACVALLMYPVMRRVCNSLISPVTYSIMTAVFANAVPFFLYAKGEIESYYFNYFIFSEILFWLFFSIGFKLNFKPLRKYVIVNDFSKSSTLYFVFSFIFVVFFIIQLKYFGFGIFSTERLAVFKGGGGAGMIQRLNGFISIFSLFYCLYVWDRCHSCRRSLRIFTGIMTLLVLANMFLTGSKSSLFQLVFVFYFYYLFFHGKTLSMKSVSILLGVAVLGGLSVVAIGNDFDGLSILGALVERLVVNGDGYFYGYPNHNIEYVSPAPWYVDLFRAFIYGLRLGDYSEATAPVGTQIMYIVMPQKVGMMVGSNSRPTLWGYAMFGLGGLCFSLIWGALLGILLKCSFSRFPKGIIGATLAYVLLNSCMFGVADPQLMFMGLFDGFIGVVFMVAILLIHELYIMANRVRIKL